MNNTQHFQFFRVIYAIEFAISIIACGNVEKFSNLILGPTLHPTVAISVFQLHFRSVLVISYLSDIWNTNY